MSVEVKQLCKETCPPWCECERCKAESSLYAPSGSANLTVKYHVIQCSGFERFLHRVNEYLEKGWKLQGGVCAVGGNSTCDGLAYYHQALWRYSRSLPNAPHEPRGTETL